MTAGLALLDEVRWNGAPVPGERSHALLAALALETSRPVGDARLVAEVWGLDEPANPTKALQVLVSRTRAQTEASLVLRSGQGYRLGDHPVDARSLSGSVRDARRALAAGDPVTARDLAREALAVPVSDATANASGGPVEQLHRRAAREQSLAREVLGRALEATGQHVEALGLLEPLVDAHPEDEGLLEALLRCEVVVRGAPAALERYERRRESVRESLGTDPGPALQRLHAELLARDRPVREGLLHDASRLIGRDDDVAALTAVVRSSRVTSILGAGGLGKTRLAHVMGRLAEQPVVHFVELAGVTSPDGVAVEVGSALGVRESVGARRLQGIAARHDLVGRILEQVGTAPTLLILDNCEHVVGAVADLVAVLVARTAQLRVLTTTRAPLGLAAERVYPLPQLALGDAIELFRERATSARPGVRLEDARVAGLVGRLDGLPLAVELAAAKVRVMAVEEIERRLENRFALLRGGSRDAPERHQTLLAVIDWSWNLLTEDERVALRRLSVFRDGFSLAAAETVVVPPGSPDSVLELVTRLVDQSLVTVVEDESVGGTRYRLLETVREFGRMQLIDAGDDQLAEQRLRGWAIGVREREMPRLSSREQVRAMRSVRVEEGNLTDVLRLALADGDVATVVPVMALLSLFWSIEGNHLKVLGFVGPLEAVIADKAVPSSLDDDLRDALSAAVFNTMIISGGPSPASLARMRSLGPGTGEPRVRALVQLLLTVAEGDDPFAQLAVLEAMTHDPDRTTALLARQWTSLAKENAGDAVGSIQAARSALELCDDADGPWIRALLTAQLASLCLQVGNMEEALGYAVQALPDMDGVGAVDDAMQLRAVLMMADLDNGRLDEAEAILDDIARGDRGGPSLFGGVIIEGCGRSELALARGDVEHGLALYVDAVAWGRAVTMPGAPTQTGLEPWSLFPEAAALAAHARHAPHRVRSMRDSLVTKVVRLLGRDSTSFDFPVLGSAVFAIAAWELAQADADEPSIERAVRLLVLADRFAYNRTMPSLRWGWAAELAERRHPGLVAEALAEVAGRSAIELRDDARRLVAELEG